MLNEVRGRLQEAHGKSSSGVERALKAWELPVVRLRPRAAIARTKQKPE